MFAVLSAASSARTVYGLPMLVPIALLGAQGLDSLPAWIARPIDVAAMWGGALLASALGLAWLAFTAGWRPAFLEAQSPGYVPHIGVIAEMQRVRPQGQCVAARALTEPQRALFHYFAGIKAGAGDCPLLLVHTGTNEAPKVGQGWQRLWHGTRPGDTKEFFWLLRREAD